MRAELTAATSSQQNAGVLQPYRVEIDSGAYASGVIRLTWPDGDWDIKLPDARVLTLSVRAGRTSDLAIFIWNTLIPGSGFTLHPPSGSVPGTLALEQVGRSSAVRRPQKTATRPIADRSPEGLSVALRRAIDRLGLPVSFESVWALLHHWSIHLDGHELIALARENYRVDDSGVIIGDEDDGEAFVLEDCRWDNIEQAYWEENPSADPPAVDRVFRKRTPSRYDGLEYHLDEIGHHLLSPSEEADLGDMIRRGQRAAEELRQGLADHERKTELGLAIRQADEARETFVVHNLRLVVNIAGRHQRKTEGTALDVGDLIQAGYLGLLKAVEKFDPDRGFKFSTYATWWIRQSIQRHIADYGRTVRLPVHIHDKVATVRRERDRFVARSGREPRARELVELTGLSAEDIEFLLSLQAVESLPSDLDGQHDGVSPAEESHRRLLQCEVRRAVDRLNPRTATVIIERFGLDGHPPRTLEAIGAKLGITRERVRQLEAKGLKALRARPEIRNLSNPDAWTGRGDHTPRGPLTPEQQAAWKRVRERARALQGMRRG